MNQDTVYNIDLPDEIFCDDIIESEVFVKMSPIIKRKVSVKIKSIKKAEPKIVISLDY